MSLTYKDAGVDRDQGDQFVEKIKGMMSERMGMHQDPRVISGIGGFAAVYDMLDDRAIVACTDGVGTKLKLAQQYQAYESIAQDLVGMNVNDLICTGARPLFFLDYLAAGKLSPERDQRMIKGIINACRASGMVLIGGETAEMPGVYAQEDFDLAGFAVGEVEKNRLIDGRHMRAGLSLIGISSSGPHSNGFGLIRQLLNGAEEKYARQCLAPTTLYPELILPLLRHFPTHIMGMAHITGGGVTNIPRMAKGLDYLVEYPAMAELPEIFTWLAHQMDYQVSELYQTFNMGLGFVLATDRPQEVLSFCRERNHKSWIIGQTMAGQGTVELTTAFGRAVFVDN